MPTKAGCDTNALFQVTTHCQSDGSACGKECTFAICGSQLAYNNAACNFCLSQPAATGCCTEFAKCSSDKMSTCYKCLTGATSGAACTADADFTAYTTCKTTNCKTDCGG
jgi:hypothetical protein